MKKQFSHEDLLSVRNLYIDFRSDGQRVEAVKGISFSLQKGHTVAIVGESGSGKSVTALSLTGLLPDEPLCTIRGEIDYQGKSLLSASNKALRQIRGKEIGYIFQDAATSLNPAFTIGYQIAEVIKIHMPMIKNVESRVVEVLSQVGIRNPQERYKAYPHELSGGMQQRAMIAMALVCEPKIVIADEPTTALDVTIQKQIIDLLKELKQKYQMSIIMITHNFGIVKGFADELIVMFRGQIVEQGPTNEILDNPKHPYTKALIECIPRLGQKQRRLKAIDYSTFT